MKEEDKKLIQKTCSSYCYGEKNNFGGCCTLADRDFIIGDIDDHERFLQDLQKNVDPNLRHEDVFIDYEEGSALFPERTAWQNPEHFPAMRVLVYDDLEPDEQSYPCRFYDYEKKACTVYEIRPNCCRKYLCSYLKELLEK